MTWDASKYFAKASTYWMRATAKERDTEEFLLNVAFVCELIVRGVLTQTNPALNAANDIESIMYACGVAPNKPPKTIDLTSGIERLYRLVPILSENEIGMMKALIEARNKELHGDMTEINQLTAKKIMPSIYSFIVKVIDYANQDLIAILGKEDAEQAKQVAQALSKDRSRRIKDLVHAHKDRFYSLSEDDQKKKKKDNEKGFESAVLKSGHHVKKEKCPACASFGNLIGLPVGRSSPILRGQEIVQEVRIIPSDFKCNCCDLKISGLDELMAAGFSHEYKTLDAIDPIEHFEIDVMDHIDVEEVVREYGQSMYEYQDE